MKEVKEGSERPEVNLFMVQGLQCFPWPRRQSSPSLQEESMKELVLRRSASERKLAKEKKKERKEKALSVHFGEKTPPEADLFPRSISVIGERKEPVKEATPNSSPTSEDGASKKKFKWNIKPLKMKKKKEETAEPNSDEGFESSPEKVSTGKTAGENDNEVKTETDEAESNDSEEKKEEGEEVETGEMAAAERKEKLSKFPYFRIEMSILNGKELIAMDRGGTSDPYVKVVQGDEELHRTPEKKKTVNPVWNDQFNLYIESPFTPITFQVFDRDLVGSDDFMGLAEFDLAGCDLEKSYELTLHLEDGDDEDLIKKNKKKKTLGYIVVRLVLSPLTKEEYNEILRSQKDGKAGKNLKVTGVVHVLLVQARGVLAMDGGTSSDPYCKVTLGKEKHRSKTINNTLNPKWREGMDLNWYEELDDFIDIALFDHDEVGKDDRMGRVEIDLRELSREVSHNLWRPIKEGEGQLNVIITISGTTKVWFRNIFCLNIPGKLTIQPSQLEPSPQMGAAA